MTDWQPIETVPFDEWVLMRWYAATKSGSCSWVIVQARRIKDTAFRPTYETWDYRLFSDPALWMPLPEAPKI